MKSVMALVLAGSGVAVAQDAVQWRVEDGGNGHWYQQHEATGCIQSDTQFANDLGGNLLCVTSHEEWMFITEYALSESAVFRIGALGPAITGDSWEWVTGEDWTVEYWAPANSSCPNSPYPNNGASGAQVIVNNCDDVYGGLIWDDYGQCDNEETVLVEWSEDCNNDGIVDYGQIVDGTLKDYDHDNIPDICEAVEWSVSDGGNGHWYFSFQSEVPLSAEDHFSEAELLSGHTITITSPEENEIGFLVDGGRSSFIGLRKQAGNNVPAWVTGEEVTYTNWYSGEGSNSQERYANYWAQSGPPSSGWQDTNLTPDILSVIEFEADCNNDGLVDFGQIITGQLVDIDGNAVPDCCESDVSCGPDCDQDGISDADEIAGGSASDFNSNGIPDNCEADCDSDGIADFIEIDQGIEFDCNFNATPDGCELADGSAEDANGNTFIDACEIDCNGNGFFDFLDLFAGAAQDCTSNGIPDSCDIAEGVEADCDLNGVPDSCETFADCDSNGIPDFCDPDCDSDGTPDACEGSEDCDANGVPDECQADADSDGTIDACDPDDDGDGIEDGCDIDNTMGEDCDLNGIDDTCDSDLDGDLIPDACDDDADGDGVLDVCDASFAPEAPSGLSLFQWKAEDGGNSHWYAGVNPPGGSISWEVAFLSAEIAGGTLIQLETEAEYLWFKDNLDLLPEGSFTNTGYGPHIGAKQILSDLDYSEPLGGWYWGGDWVVKPVPLTCFGEVCDWIQNSGGGSPGQDVLQLFIQPGTNTLTFNDTTQDNFEDSQVSFVIEWETTDCNFNGVLDSCELGMNDCNDNGILDSCELSQNDCNSNDVLDQCELETNDCNANGIPDDCDGLADCNANGVGDVCDIESGTSIDVNLDGIPDECQCVPDIVTDGVVDFTDLLTLLNEYGPCPPPCRSDLNGDGVVDFADALRLLSAWGSCDG